MEDFTNELILKLNSISWQLKRIADVMERDQKAAPKTNVYSVPTRKLQDMLAQVKASSDVKKNT